MTDTFLEDTKVRDERGNLIMVFRGDFSARALADGFRVVEYGIDGGSGGIYFTESAEVASNYAIGKEHFDENACETHEHIDVTWAGRKMPLSDCGHHLSLRQRDMIARTVLSLDTDHGYSGEDTIVSRHTWERYLKDCHNDPVAAATEVLFHSGMLGRDEFVNFWSATGVFDEVIYHDPYTPNSVVTPCYLDIRNPLDMTDLPSDLYERLHARLGDDETLEFLEYSLRHGINDETVIFLTKEFREALIAEGYDGIRDVGGVAGGGDLHTVWIAFDPSQIVPAYCPEGVRYRQSLPEDTTDAAPTFSLP